MTSRRDFRVSVLRAHGAGPEEVEELLAYTESPFRPPDEPPEIPLPDEPFVAAWEAYAAEAGETGVWECLRSRLPQLKFPVEEGISDTEAYHAATRRGEATWPETGVVLRRPDALRLFLHPTPAGRLPVLVIGDRDDFMALVRALAHRGEPRALPESMGALAVGGFANWDRIGALRRAWEAEHPDDEGDGWREEWRSIIPRKELYHDRFVLLSRGPYSGVPAGDVGMSAGEWDDASLTIRLEHECAHYFSRRVFGAMRNNAFDELYADYAGIVAAAGAYRPEWALRFLGLEEHPRFREGGRLANYRGTPPLSDAAFAVLRSLVHAAVHALAGWDAGTRRGGAERTLRERADALAALLRLTLEDLAADDAAGRLKAAREDPWGTTAGTGCASS